MPVDYRQLADLEEGLGEEHLSEVRFGRSRFLRKAGLVLFGIAAGTVSLPAEEAEAAPPGCYGYPTCGTCRGRYCRRCRSRLSTHCPPSGVSNQCWRSRYNAATTSTRSATPAYAEVIALEPPVSHGGNESHPFRGAASRYRARRPRRGILAQLRGDGLDLRVARPRGGSNGARPADAPVRP